jgi:lysophospholipase L1-like esterase
MPWPKSTKSFLMNYFKLVRIVVFLFLLNVSYSGFSQKRIAVIGSSSAAGYFPSTAFFPKDSAWVYKVKKYFKDLGIIDTLFNLAQSSTDCFEGMPTSYVPPAGFNYRLPNPNINITKAVNLIPKPDVIIVNYPSNSYDWISNDQVITCLQIIKDSANAKNIRCYITTTQPRDGFSPSERLKLKTLRDLILAHFGEWAIDFFTDIVQEPGLGIKTIYAAGDGVHLNPEGHTVLKNKVLEKNLFFGTVPIRFEDLSALPQSDKIILNWKTFFENPHVQFIIETSTDGIHFLPLATLLGQSNSTVPQTYSFTHSYPSDGQNYYRIVAVPIQGDKEYSNIVVAKFKKKQSGNVIATYTNNLINLTLKEPLKSPAWVNIFNMQGKLILNKKIEKGNTIIHPIHIWNLSSGKYLVQVIFEDHKETTQIMKL